MNSERSKSQTIHKGDIDTRIKELLSRQKKREIDHIIKDLTSYKGIEVNKDFLEFSLKNSKDGLSDLKKTQTVLKQQLNNKGSYLVSSALRKLTKKCDEIEKNVNIIQTKSKQINQFEHRLKSLISSKEKISKNTTVLSASASHKSAFFSEKNSRKINAEDTLTDSIEIGTPQFCLSKSGYIPIEDLTSSQNSISKFDFSGSMNQKNFIKLSPEKQNTVKKTEKSEEIEDKMTCKSVLEYLIDKVIDLDLAKKQNELKLSQEKLQKDIEEFQLYHKKMLDFHSSKSRELDEKEKKLKNRESEIDYQLNLLKNEKCEKLLKFKLEEVERKELKLRQKQLDLLEFKEVLSDKEEELAKRESLLKLRCSSVYEEYIKEECRDSWLEYLVRKSFESENKESVELDRVINKK